MGYARGNMQQQQQDQGAYVWPKMQDEQQWNTWCRGVESIFKRWTCLRLAVEGGWGHDTDQNERELFNQVLTVFQRGQRVYVDELEGALEDFVSEKLFTNLCNRESVCNSS